jgi:hypothetical protein
MHELLKNPTLAKRLGEHARQVACDRFGLERFIRDWNAAFALVMSYAEGSRGVMNAASTAFGRRC